MALPSAVSFPFYFLLWQIPQKVGSTIFQYSVRMCVCVCIWLCVSVWVCACIFMLIAKSLPIRRRWRKLFKYNGAVRTVPRPSSPLLLRLLALFLYCCCCSCCCCCCCCYKAVRALEKQWNEICILKFCSADKRAKIFVHSSHSRNSFS